jgi:nucleoside 2-deoxyribosyltransferase
MKVYSVSKIDYGIKKGRPVIKFFRDYADVTAFVESLLSGCSRNCVFTVKPDGFVVEEDDFNKFVVKITEDDTEGFK